VIQPWFVHFLLKETCFLNVRNADTDTDDEVYTEKAYAGYHIKVANTNSDFQFPISQ
jgi:hypothetical protein